MNLSKAAQVYGAVCKMMEREVSFSFAHTLCMAKERLEPHAMFYTEKEMDLIRKYASPREDGSLTDETGRFQVAKEKADAYFQEKGELDGVEVKIEKIHTTTAPERISGKDLELLMEILDFEDDGGTGE